MPTPRPNSLTFQIIDHSNVDALAEGLSAVHEAVRGEARDPGYWRWCYVDTPLGSAGSVVALDGGRVVGKLGKVPVRVVVGGRRAVATVYEGLHVLPSSRSWRCYLGLIGARSAAAAGPACVPLDGVGSVGLRTPYGRGKPLAERPLWGQPAFGYAFVTRPVAQLSARSGAVRLGRVPFWVGFLSVARALAGRSAPVPLARAGGLFQPWVGVRRRGRPPAGLEIKPVERFGRAFDDLWRGLERGRTVAAVRDAGYLNWRYVECPGRQYSRLAAFREGRIEGLVVFRSRPRRGDAFVVELLARKDAPDVLRALLLQALRAMAREGAGVVAAGFPAGSAEEAAVRDLGFQPWAGWLLGIQLMLSRDAGGPSGPERRLANWYFSLGDWLIY